ncbi:hypothetical protein [Archangium violaceum]|uniref:Lipoprotein n=1 Tax=Archangium violaceum Cb vi76 TaxID=1406225 RepID=A0A084SMS6_9BACT|nr:hypothetical protein [Archangium violaceum]KFA89761.1 hypothetical protein Q664_33315 [Archangium violaceum Cb vi76]
MRLHAPLLALVLVSLATACHEDVLLPPLEEEPPPFAFALYLEDGQLRPHADVLLVRRPKHLERVYSLSLAEDTESGGEQARLLFGIIEAEFRGAGVYVANSPSQNAQVQADVQYLQNLGATNIRVNQQQLMVENRQRVGVNRPDLQFDYNGRRYHVEYDTPVSGRGPAHQSRATSNDPNAEIILLIVP